MSRSLAASICGSPVSGTLAPSTVIVNPSVKQRFAASFAAVSSPRLGEHVGNTPPQKRPNAPGFVVLHQIAENQWEFLGEVPRRLGLPARAPRKQAIWDATDGTARDGQVYAAVLRSEWRIALD
jgi:hypothetical protein